MKLFAGRRSDPFFFNLQGFKDTVSAVEAAGERPHVRRERLPGPQLGDVDGSPRPPLRRRRRRPIRRRRKRTISPRRTSSRLSCRSTRASSTRPAGSSPSGAAPTRGSGSVMKNHHLLDRASALAFGITSLAACSGDDTATPARRCGRQDGRKRRKRAPAPAPTREPERTRAPAPTAEETPRRRRSECKSICMGRPAISTALNHSFDATQTTKDAAKDAYATKQHSVDLGLDVHGGVREEPRHSPDSLDTMCGNQALRARPTRVRVVMARSAEFSPTTVSG